MKTTITSTTTTVIIFVYFLANKIKTLFFKIKKNPTFLSSGQTSNSPDSYFLFPWHAFDFVWKGVKRGERDGKWAGTGVDPQTTERLMKRLSCWILSRMEPNCMAVFRHTWRANTHYRMPVCLQCHLRSLPGRWNAPISCGRRRGK